MIITKFGGTSVIHLDQVSEIIKDNTEPKIIVLSAFSQVTNQLDKLNSFLNASQKLEARDVLSEIKKIHVKIIQQFFTDSDFEQKALELLSSHINYINSFTHDLFTSLEEKAILAQGEILSTSLFQLYLEQNNIDSVLLSSLDFMRIDKDGEPDKFYIQENLERIIKEYKGVKLFIAQGYICRNAFGEVDNLKRGGSDYSASLIGVAAKAKQIQIWTDIDGLHNNDPRFVKDTESIKEISFDESAELAYFGAKILHPLSIFPAKESNIPVLLKNTFEPSKVGTHIANFTNVEGIKSIAAKDGITAIKIKSDRMLMAYGFLRNIFDVFERYQTPVDMITTSEVAVSITIDNDDSIADLQTDLSKYGKVEIDSDFSIICIVGNFEDNKTGVGNKIFKCLENIPIRMVSYGGSNYNISLLVKTEDKSSALNALHNGFFR